MTWFRVDDAFHDHPKVVSLAEGKLYSEALSLWLLSGVWCAKQLTDGSIPDRKLASFGIKRWRAAAQELVRVGLWNPSENGFNFHQWTEHQPTREAVESQRVAAKERKRKSREGHAVTSPAVTRDSHDPVTVVPHPPDPTRPDPSVERARAVGEARGLDEAIRRNAASVLETEGVTRGREHRDIDAPTAPIWGELARWCIAHAKTTSSDPRDVAALVLCGWVDDERCRGKGHPLSWLIRNPMEYYIAGIEGEKRRAS